MNASWTEDALQFDCDGAPLIGILSMPAEDASRVEAAVVIVVGGPQYRVGAHRQFVHLARTLASDGHAVLRFDQRGMGDSSGAVHAFDDRSADIGAAIMALRARVPQARRLILFGLCDGAAATLLYLHHAGDRSVDGVCLLNPWVRSEASLARTHVKHYYASRLVDPTFWRKAIAGGVGGRQLVEFLRTWRLSRQQAPAPPRATFQQAMAAAWKRFEGQVLLLLSEDDFTAREFIEHAAAAPEWRGLLDGPCVKRQLLAGADHTLSTTASRVACEHAVRAWLSPWPGRVQGHPG